MLRQVYEYRVHGYPTTAEHEIEMRLMSDRLHKNFFDESGQPKSHLTQKQFEEYMKHADEVAKKWL